MSVLMSLKVVTPQLAKNFSIFSSFSSRMKNCISTRLLLALQESRNTVSILQKTLSWLVYTLSQHNHHIIFTAMQTKFCTLWVGHWQQITKLFENYRYFK